MNEASAEDSFEQAELVWSPVIGQFILEFATIEDFLHSVISWYLRDKHVTEFDLKDGLPSRLSLFKKIIIEILESQQDKTKLSSAVEGIGALVKIRNLLAHNSLSLEMEETQEGTIRAIGPIISGRKDPSTSITLETLVLKLSELKRHRNDMADLLSIFHAYTLK